MMANSSLKDRLLSTARIVDFLQHVLHNVIPRYQAWQSACILLLSQLLAVSLLLLYRRMGMEDKLLSYLVCCFLALVIKPS